MEKSRDHTLSQRDRITHPQPPPPERHKLHAQPAKQVREALASLTPEAIPKVTAEERFRMIADAAYFKAERRGFASTDLAAQERDWLDAETEIDATLRNAGVLGE